MTIKIYFNCYNVVKVYGGHFESEECLDLSVSHKFHPHLLCHGFSYNVLSSF